MEQVLYGSAMTTAPVPRTIQHIQENLRIHQAQ